MHFCFSFAWFFLFIFFLFWFCLLFTCLLFVFVFVHTQANENKTKRKIKSLSFHFSLICVGSVWQCIAIGSIILHPIICDSIFTHFSSFHHANAISGQSSCVTVRLALVLHSFHSFVDDSDHSPHTHYHSLIFMNAINHLDKSDKIIFAIKICVAMRTSAVHFRNSFIGL